MTRQGRLRRRFWKMFPLLQLLGCGQVVLQTTDETVENTNPSITDAGTVNDTFYVSGAALNDPCGKPVVLRGVNEMPTFIALAKDGSSCFGEITQTGANAIRLYWQTSDSPGDLDRLLLNAEAKRLLPVVYVFSTSSPTTTFEDAASYWTRPDIVPIAIKHRQWLIIALRERNASETALNTSAWTSSVDSAVQRIRAAGINVPLAVDAPQYGMDTASLVQLGPARIQADPRQNIIFSITAWWANADSGAIETHLRDVISAGLPTMVGEFSGWAQASSSSNSDCLNIRYDYATIIRVGQETSTGWFAWSWGAANNYPCTTFNMTSDGRYATLLDWGYNVAVADPYSIRNTSIAAKFVPGAGCN